MRAINTMVSAGEDGTLPIMLARPNKDGSTEYADEEFLFKFVACGLFNTSSTIVRKSYLLPAKLVLLGVC